ncbi:MAG TPA: division/cell wall cluster transcriptional repressor MraZ [Actinomycetota bacterium]|nr:division/cell wall cluster transcriptional repressor MraZ [Actinomycetota bacterium]
MFLGEERRGLDDKGRLIFPSKMRDELGSAVVLQKGIERCLYVYPIGEWTRQVEKVTSLPTTHPDSRRYARHFFSQATQEALDKQNRITIPPSFRGYAGLEREVVVAGAGARLEIWEPEAWRRQAEQAESDLPDFTQELGI